MVDLYLRDLNSEMRAEHIKYIKSEIERLESFKQDIEDEKANKLKELLKAYDKDEDVKIGVIISDCSKFTISE